MKLEYLASGSQDCPLIRLYSFDQAEVARLREVVEALSQGSVQSADLQNEPWVESIGSCKLTLRSGAKDLGMLQDGSASFECILTTSEWKSVKGLIDPFCESPTGAYQWLSKQGKIALLLSPSGKW